jgi:hypothetical protein
MYSIIDDTDWSRLRGLPASEVLFAAAKIMREHDQHHIPRASV